MPERCAFQWAGITGHPRTIFRGWNVDVPDYAGKRGCPDPGYELFHKGMSNPLKSGQKTTMLSPGMSSKMAQAGEREIA